MNRKANDERTRDELRPTQLEQVQAGWEEIVCSFPAWTCTHYRKGHTISWPLSPDQEDRPAMSAVVKP